MCLQESNYTELISNLKSMRNFCLASIISEFPQDYDFVQFLSDCISVNDPYDVMIEAIKLLKQLFIQQSFVEYFSASKSSEALLDQLSILLHQAGTEMHIHILESYINLSGGSSDERDLSLRHLDFEYLFLILKNDLEDQEIKYLAARLIHNYCRHKVEVDTGKQIMNRYIEVWNEKITPDVKIELNWSIKHLAPSLGVFWIKTIKLNHMKNILIECLVYDNPQLAISSLFIIFQLMQWNEPFDFDFDYIMGLLKDFDSIDNISIGCFCVRHLIKLSQSKATIAKELIDFGIFDQILVIYQTAPFECKMDAMSAFCAFAKCNLTEYFDFFYENNFVQLFLEFFNGPINLNLKLEMLKTLLIIFDKAKKQGNIETIKDEFLDNDGVEIFESFYDDENDIDGKLATKADLFLSLYIDDE